MKVFPMLTRIYLVVGPIVLLLYAMAAYSGWEVGTLDREDPKQAQARHISGGHRSHTYWFFRGGK